ncbi:SpoVR family protein, partial [Escherichia sp. SP-MK]
MIPAVAHFSPQKQTQVMNEGWATFWHYTIDSKS